MKIIALKLKVINFNSIPKMVIFALHLKNVHLFPKN